MGLRDVGETLPPGFRFYPSDEELVCHYLYKKIANEEVLRGTLVEIDLHVCDPWHLPDVAKLNSNEWYFFSFRDRKYSTGLRANRATSTGYWKATGKDRVVIDSKIGIVVGMRKTLVFYRNRAPNGIKTGWIMHEFRLENPHHPPKEDWVLCRVFYKCRSSAEDINKLMINPHNFYNSTNGPNLVASSRTTTEHVIYQDKVTCFSQNARSSPTFNMTNTSLDERATLDRPEHLHPPQQQQQQHNVNNDSDHLCNMVCDTHGDNKMDEYAFMFEFDGSNGVPSSLDDMGIDDDNSSGFI